MPIENIMRKGKQHNIEKLVKLLAHIAVDIIVRKRRKRYTNSFLFSDKESELAPILCSTMKLGDPEEFSKQNLGKKCLKIYFWKVSHGHIRKVRM